MLAHKTQWLRLAQKNTLEFFLRRSKEARHSLCDYQTGKKMRTTVRKSKTEPPCEDRKTLLWPSSFMEAKGGRSWGSKLVRETCKPKGWGFSVRSEVTRAKKKNEKAITLFEQFEVRISCF